MKFVKEINLFASCREISLFSCAVVINVIAVGLPTIMEIKKILHDLVFSKWKIGDNIGKISLDIKG